MGLSLEVPQQQLLELLESMEEQKLPSWLMANRIRAFFAEWDYAIDDFGVHALSLYVRWFESEYARASGTTNL